MKAAWFPLTKRASESGDGFQNPLPRRRTSRSGRGFRVVWEEHPETTDRFANYLFDHLELLRSLPYIGTPIKDTLSSGGFSIRRSTSTTAWTRFGERSKSCISPEGTHILKAHGGATQGGPVRGSLETSDQRCSSFHLDGVCGAKSGGCSRPSIQMVARVKRLVGSFLAPAFYPVFLLSIKTGPGWVYQAS